MQKLLKAENYSHRCLMNPGLTLQGNARALKRLKKFLSQLKENSMVASTSCAMQKSCVTRK